MRPRRNREARPELQDFFEFFKNLKPVDRLQDAEWYIFNPIITDEERGLGELDLVMVRKNCRNEFFIACSYEDVQISGRALDTYFGSSSFTARPNGDGRFVSENRDEFYVLDRDIPLCGRGQTIGEVLSTLNINFEEVRKPAEKTDLAFEVQLFGKQYQLRLQELKLENPPTINVPAVPKNCGTDLSSSYLAREVLPHLADDGKMYIAQVYERGSWKYLCGAIQRGVVMPLIFNGSRDYREAMGGTFITAFYNTCDKGIKFGRYFYEKDIYYSPCRISDELHTR